jgi:methyl-accepting chemotaxis protein
MATPASANRLTSSLLLKFLLLLLLVIVPISLVVGIFNYNTAGSLLKEKVQTQQLVWVNAHRDALTTELIQEGERLNDLGTQPFIHERLQSPVSSTETLTTTAQAWIDSGVNGVLRYGYVVNSPLSNQLSNYRQRFPNRTFVLLGDTSGALVGVTTLNWPEYDLRKFSWWPKLDSNNIAPISLTEPQTIPQIGTDLILIISIITDPAHDDRPIGVLVVGLPTDQIVTPILTSSANDLAVGDHTWLINKDGTILAAYEITGNFNGSLQISTSSSVTQLPASWLAQIKPRADGGSIEIGHQSASDPPDSVFAYSPLLRNVGYAQNDPTAIAAINQLNWTVVRSAPQSLAYASLNGTLIALAAGIILTFVAIVAVVVVIVRGVLLRPIRRMERAMGAVAQGNFAARVEGIGSDELGRLGRRFNGMVTDLDTLLQEREQHQHEQQLVSTRLQGSASELQGSVAQQNEFAVQQAAALAEISTTFSQLSHSATRIAQYSQQVAEAADVLQDEQHQGNVALQQTQTVLGQLRTDSESLGVIAESLNRSSSAISGVIEELNNIADETKLLALNAAIEASGAGLAGRRFSVIATEVQTLADQSNAAAEAAQRSLSEVQANINEAVTSIQRELQAIGEGVQQSARLETLMQIISDTINKLNQSAGIIQQDTKQQREGSVSVAGAIDSLASASQQLAQRSTVITNEAVELSKLAQRLNVQNVKQNGA